MYLVMQSKELGKETDAAEDVLLETEWRVHPPHTSEGNVLISLRSIIPESELVDVTKKIVELLS